MVGVLLKYVNLGIGWRPRLFVLREGVFSYYKVFGAGATVNAARLLEYLRGVGEVYLVGVEVSMVERRDVRRGGAGGVRGRGVGGGAAIGSGPPLPPPPPYAAMPTPSAEIHLQVSGVRESESDARKFYVHTGSTSMTLRAETADDRWIWLAALRSAKTAWARASSTPRGGEDASGRAETAAFEGALTSVSARVRAQGGSASLEAGVREAFIAEHERQESLREGDARRAEVLLARVYELENERRQLETALVVEGRSRGSGGMGGDGGGDGSGAPNLTRRSSALSFSDGAASEDEREGTGLGDGAALGAGPDAEDTEEEEFFDAAEVTSDGEGGTPRVEGGGASGTASGAPGTLRGHSRRSSMTMEPAPGLCTPTHSVSREAGVVLEVDGSGPAVSAPAPVEPRPPTPASTDDDDAGWALALKQGKTEKTPVRRTRLPAPEQAEKSVSLWSLIKGMVGKDLSRVCLPVYFNEPLSALQTIAEGMEYSSLLDEAAGFPAQSSERLLRVAAFAVSQYSATYGRTCKPFNPLLGETYELVAPERGRGFRFLAEKVVHHPTVIAAHAVGAEGWIYSGDAEVQSRFWGRSIELRPVGILRVEFADGDAYAWSKVTTSLNNLVLGKVYVDHGGIMRVRCVGSGLTARLRFKETGLFFDKDPRSVRGQLEAGDTRYERPIISGHWDEGLDAEMPDKTTIPLWRAAPPPPDPTRYCLSAFAITLNESTPDAAASAPTDCRRRPDQHALELGRYDHADAEKQRLEVKQRAARKAADRGEPIRPRWFLDTTPVTGKPDEDRPKYQYRGGYWAARRTGDFSGCRDIFGQ